MPHIHSIAIFVTDIDRALLFYRDHLGLPLLHQGSFGAEFMDGEKGQTRLGVHPAVHPNSLAMVGRETGITLHVENLLDFCERLHQRGVNFVTEPTQQGFGIMAMVADPDGNILALWEEKLPE
jgi:predicted enzyme related to lactoylglutathione lyase